MLAGAGVGVGAYMDLALDKGGDVFLAIEDGQGLQQVAFQPFPVLCDLLTRRTYEGFGDTKETHETKEP